MVLVFGDADMTQHALPDFAVFANSLANLDTFARRIRCGLDSDKHETMLAESLFKRNDFIYSLGTTKPTFELPLGKGRCATPKNVEVRMENYFH